IRGYEHLGIPEIKFADGPVGVRNFGKSTSYPAGISIAASWDKEMAYNVGKAIGAEARAKNVHVMLAPAMNIYRLPLCGRNFEYLGEDPYLSGQMAKEYIVGMQNEGVMASAKHYAANNQEFNRHHVSSDVDERTLHEIYLPAFKTSVQEGHVASIMTSYNLINGVHASEHDYLNNEILKGRWGFDGFIMSDWVSTYDGLACAKGGLDLEMPSGKMMSKEILIPAIKNGELDESVIDDKIKRILHTYNRFGLFENSDISEGYVIDNGFVRKTALDAARGGMVLLKNANDFLPLDKSNVKTIAVIGPNGHPAITGGGGSSFVNPLYPKSLFEAIQNIAGENIEVTYETGVFTGVKFPENMFDDFEFYVYENGEKEKGINGKYYNGKNFEGDVILSKFYENLKLVNDDMWEEPEIPEEDYSARFNAFFTPKESGNYLLGVLGDDGYRLFLDDVEVISEWRDQGDFHAKHEGFFNAGQEYKIDLEYYQSGGDARIKLGVKKYKQLINPKQYPTLALEAAKKADIVVMAVGFDPSTESEGFDRTFEMPYKQSELIKKISTVNKNIIVVINSGGNVEMDSWIKNVKGLLMTWYPGQEGNIAAAEILFGITNPSGKLPASFEYKIEDNPTYNFYFDEDEDLRVNYGEGLFVGYRFWDKSNNSPRFPFGFGLSYTEFEYSDFTIAKKEYSKDETIKLSVNVKNVGKSDGAEIVQLYVSDKVSSLPRPVKELKDFGKVFLEKGEIKTIEFELEKDAFSFYNPESHQWEIESGEFEILIGSSSVDIREKVTINLE
nr:glycoside hydrolase family 3 C-terminal domain-containing protein [Melioribacteraceae bacterium]